MTFSTALSHAVLTSIPSPSHGELHLGSLPLRGYALAIIIGIVVCVIVAERRWVARGGESGTMQDIALWAVPFGIVGGRIYHVITDHDLYFGAGKTWYHMFYIWNGGLGIWGAIMLGTLGAYIGARVRHVDPGMVFDAIAPALLLAQGIGRWGNWFNQELYGRPTTLPWGLRIDPSHWPQGMTFPAGTTFHPTFLYESIWDIAMFFIVVFCERRFKLSEGKPSGRVLAAYVMAYCAGRFWIEKLRIDTIELNNVLGMRWGDWMSIILFALALIYMGWAIQRHKRVT